jgi:hypothetical protein
VSDAGLKHLRAMGHLRSLWVWRTRVTARGVAELREARPAVRVQG